MSDELIDYLDEVAAIEISVGSIVAKAVLAALPGYTQRIQAETLVNAAAEWADRDHMHGSTTDKTYRFLLRLAGDAAALAAPVEPLAEGNTAPTCNCKWIGGEDSGVVLEPLVPCPIHGAPPAPPVEQPPTQEER